MKDDDERYVKMRTDYEKIALNFATRGAGRKSLLQISLNWPFRSEDNYKSSCSNRSLILRQSLLIRCFVQITKLV